MFKTMQMKLNIKLKNTKDSVVELNQDEFIRHGLKFADFGGSLSPSAL